MTPILTNREYQVNGTWYAPQKKLESFKSVVKVELTDTTSSAGDWDGYFVQKVGRKWYLIFFTQENNYPNEGFTLRTNDEPFEVFDHCPTPEHLWEIIHEAI